MTDDLVKRYDVYPAYHGVDVEECHVGEFVYYADHADRIEQLTAERDRLRAALEQFLIEYDVVDLANAEPLSLTAAVLEARAALKGESHD